MKVGPEHRTEHNLRHHPGLDRDRRSRDVLRRRHLPRRPGGSTAGTVILARTTLPGTALFLGQLRRHRPAAAHRTTSSLGVWTVADGGGHPDPERRGSGGPRSSCRSGRSWRPTPVSRTRRRGCGTRTGSSGNSCALPCRSPPMLLAARRGSGCWGWPKGRSPLPVLRCWRVVPALDLGSPRRLVSARTRPEVGAPRPRPAGHAPALVVLVQPVGLQLHRLALVRPGPLARSWRGRSGLNWYFRALGGEDRAGGGHGRGRARLRRRPGHAGSRRRGDREPAVPGPHVRGPRAEDRPREDRPRCDRGARSRFCCTGPDIGEPSTRRSPTAW